MKKRAPSKQLKSISLRIFLTLALPVSAASNAKAAGLCSSALFAPAESVEAFVSHEPIANKNDAFLKLKAGFQAAETDLRKILAKINTAGGIDLEISLAKTTIENGPQLESFSLSHVKVLNNVAVYGSTNVPLYTLFAHGILPSLMARNVWFRTPEATREIYQELYLALARYLPPEFLKGLHMLTTSRDVQYDNFQKMYVLGLNKHGTRVDRPPAELVIFTGSPETGKGILEKMKSKITEFGDKVPAHQQLFLGFGAGINPIVITSSARTRMPEVVQSVLEVVRINNGQDCLSADFIAVHQEAFKNFQNEFLRQIRTLKVGSLGNREADLLPLSMSKNLDRLVTYRERYKKYLINQDAVFDPINKIVGPHLFIFPQEMWGQVEIQEHFAPFFSVFKYSGQTFLEKVAATELIQQKAMYAVVLGGNRQTDEMTEATDAFRRKKHFVITNRSLFNVLEPNLPFGGRGHLSSMMSFSSWDSQGHYSQRTGHYPVHISSEVRRFFPRAHVPKAKVLKTSLYYRQELAKLISVETQNADSLDQKSPWRHLKNPLMHGRPRGLQNLRTVIEKEGLYQYAERKSDEFDGFPTLGPSKDIKKGVVLHLTAIDQEVGALNKLRGTINPILGFGYLVGHLQTKWAEYVLAEGVRPGSMPHAERLDHLIENHILSETTQNLRVRAIEQIENLGKSSRNLSESERTELRKSLVNLVESLFFDIRNYFPEGAYFKNYGEFATGDLGTMVTSFSTSSRELVDEYLRRLEVVISDKKLKGPYHGTEARRAILEDEWAMGVRFLDTYFSSPEKIMVQSRVHIARTAQGLNQEFRVDFIDGEPVFSKLRYGNEYYPDLESQAKDFVTEFFKTAPEQARYLSGGADVARLEDGSWVFIEFNFGGASGTWVSDYFPIDRQYALSGLMGKPTAKLIQLDQIYNSGIEAQVAFLKRQPNLKPVWARRSWSDVSVFEYARYFRNRFLIDWTARGASPADVSAVQLKIRQLFQSFDQKGYKDLQDLELGAIQYIRRTHR